MDFSSIVSLVQSGGLGAIVYLIYIMMSDIKAVKVDMAAMTASFNKKLYAEDGKLIYRRIDDCNAEMRECGEILNTLRSRTHDHTNKLIELEMRLKALE